MKVVLFFLWFLWIGAKRKWYTEQMVKYEHQVRVFERLFQFFVINFYKAFFNLIFFFCMHIHFYICDNRFCLIKNAKKRVFCKLGSFILLINEWLLGREYFTERLSTLRCWLNWERNVLFEWIKCVYSWNVFFYQLKL